MRVLFVVHDSGISGAQRVLLTLLHGLDRSRFECHVVAPYDGPFVGEVRALGHQVHIRSLVRWVPSARRVAKTGLVRYLGSFISGLRARSQSIARLIERHGVETVITNTVVCLEGAIAARMAGVPHVWFIHESISGNPDLRGILPAFVYRAVIGFLSTEAVCVSRSLAANYGRLRHRCRVVHPGLLLPQPPNRESARTQLLQRTGFPATARLVGVVAALQPGKDHPTFLAAAKAVREHRPDTCFVIVGSGAAGYTNGLELLTRSLGLASCTRFLGQLPHSEIHDLMAGLDVLVISSIQESFGLTAIEALAVDTPVVSTLCGGPTEIIRDGIDGRLVPVGDAAAMARAINTTLTDAAKGDAHAQSGHERVTRTFAVERFLQEMTDVIESASKARDDARADRRRSS